MATRKRQRKNSMKQEQEPLETAGSLFTGKGEVLRVSDGGSVYLGGKTWRAHLINGTLELTHVGVKNDGEKQINQRHARVKHEIAKRKEEVGALRVQRSILTTQLEELDGEGDPTIVTEITELTLAVGNHLKQLKVLEGMVGADVQVTTTERTERLELPGGVRTKLSLTSFEEEVLWSPPQVVVETTLVAHSIKESVSTKYFPFVGPFEGIYVRHWGNKGQGDGQFYLPVDVALTGDEVFVCDGHNNRIQVCSRDGSYLRQWGSLGVAEGEFFNPNSIAVHRSEVFVVDQGNNRVQVFDLHGTFLRQWGSKGSEDGQFKSPTAVSVAGREVFVLDHGNYRVQVFGLDGSFIRKWGSEGEEDGEFAGNGDLVVHNGEVFVADTNNCRIQVFSVEGAFLRKWGSQGDGPGQFQYPEAVSISGSEVVVTDKRKLQVFSLTGTEGRQVIRGQDLDYFGMASMGGELFVCNNDRIYVFK